MEIRFKNYLVDQGGNIFKNGKCINPKRTDYAVHEDGVYRSKPIDCKDFYATSEGDGFMEDRFTGETDTLSPFVRVTGHIDVTEYLEMRARLEANREAKKAERKSKKQNKK